MRTRAGGLVPTVGGNLRKRISETIRIHQIIYAQSESDARLLSNQAITNGRILTVAAAIRDEVDNPF